MSKLMVSWYHDDTSSIPKDCLSSWAIVFLSASSSSVRKIFFSKYDNVQHNFNFVRNKYFYLNDHRVLVILKTIYT